MKVRLRYSKLGKVRFVGNLDVVRIWERALRKAALPVAYSTGFSPRPRLSFGLALPMAAESEAEYLDVELASDVPVDVVEAHVNDALPAGFAVLAAREKHAGERSLQEVVVACDWELTLTGFERARLEAAVALVLASPEVLLERERKGERRIDDVRPSIESLEVGGGGELLVSARLATVGRGLRPSELVDVLARHADRPSPEGAVDAVDPADLVRRVMRTEQWIECDGARREVLPRLAAVAASAGTTGREEDERNG